jgi:hypothetical protein
VLLTFGTLLLLIPISLIAEFQRDVVPLKPWPAPLFWQTSQAENRIVAKPGTFGNAVAEDTRPANSLVFVGMTPCRVVDTRTGQGFTGAFGPPSLVGGASRTFPIQSSPNCSIPPIAQAYSFNITVVTFSFLDFITVWPTGQARPNASTLNGYVQTVIANAAIVPAGTSGSIDVYASQSTDLIIDINGYYAPQTGITLAQGSAGAPSLSFAGDSGTGIFLSGTGSLSIATGGTNRLTVRSDGDLDLAGSIRKGGTPFLHNLGSANTGVGLGALAVNTGTGNTASGEGALQSNTNGYWNTATGAGALTQNTNGPQNTASGYHALYANTSGSGNTAIGLMALQSNTTGYGNVASGGEALGFNTIGLYNTASGLVALKQNTSGSGNTATGAEALEFNTIGSHNTAHGGAALFYNTSGSGNTADGAAAGIIRNSATGNTTGSNNTFIGSYSGPGTSAELNNATAIGSNAVVSASNALVLGDSAVRVGIGTSIPTAKLDVNGGVRLNTITGKPACDETTRGTFWFTQGGAGVKDAAEVCAKDASNAYAWRILY